MRNTGNSDQPWVATYLSNPAEYERGVARSKNMNMTCEPFFAKILRHLEDYSRHVAMSEMPTLA